MLIVVKPLLHANQNYSNLLPQNMKKYFDVLNGFDQNHGLLCVLPRSTVFGKFLHLNKLTSVDIKKTQVCQINRGGYIKQFILITLTKNTFALTRFGTPVAFTWKYSICEGVANFFEQLFS